MIRGMEFFKYSGSGNDFIIIDNRDNVIKERDLKRSAILLCDRKKGIGADGLLLIEKSSCSFFKMRIINSDGSEAEMCGNGARCIAHFAFFKKVAPANMRFETLAGLIDAVVKDNTKVKVKLTQPYGLRKDIKISYKNKKFILYYINTGVPHTVIFVNNNLDKVNIKDIGRYIRYHKYFAPAGTNVNFVKIIDKHNIEIRTYERGVEDETFACGTGATASAIISGIIRNIDSPVKVKTKSRERLKIYFKINQNDVVDNVYLEGKITPIFKGTIL